MTYLSIRKKAFNKLKDAAKDKDEGKNNYVFDDLIMMDAEVEFEKETGKLDIFGSLMIDKTELGWVSVEKIISLDLAVEIIEFYMKKLGKLKTVLEATK